MTYERWTAAQEREARKLWRAGEPVRSIAALLNRTRNAVISRANRSGWGTHANSPRKLWNRT